MLNRRHMCGHHFIYFEDYLQSSCKPFVGEKFSVPMNCWGSVVNVYEVIEIRQDHEKFYIVGKKVA